MYGAPTWNSILRKDINLIEKVKKRLTEYMRGKQDDDSNDLS